MAIRPILFSGPMVLALLAGTKTQTRRAIKPRRPFSLFDGSWSDSYVIDPGNASWRNADVRVSAGDLLWVRERGWMSPRKDAFVPLVDNEGQTPTSPQDGAPYKATPSIHMPRWASRLTLEVTEVRVQRLHEISEADAESEGSRSVYGEPFHEGASLTDRRRYELLWNSINGAGSWDANPWVAAYSFTVHRHNVDALIAMRSAALASPLSREGREG